MKFLSFSIALLFFSSFDFSGVKGSEVIEDHETYFPIKMKLNKFADWAVYHFHGDIYFKDDGDVALRVSVRDKHIKDCGTTDRPNRPIMKSIYADHDKGYMYGYMKPTKAGIAVGNLHVHDLVGGKVTFENEVKGVAVEPHCEKGVCENWCTVYYGDVIATKNNRNYYKKVEIQNRRKYTPCGVDLFFRQQTKGSEIADSDTFRGDYFVGAESKFEKVKPRELVSDKTLQYRLWCLDRDCENRAQILRYENGKEEPFQCMDLRTNRFGVSECNDKKDDPDYTPCVVDVSAEDSD